MSNNKDILLYIDIIKHSYIIFKNKQAQMAVTKKCTVLILNFGFKLQENLWVI